MIGRVLSAVYVSSPQQPEPRRDGGRPLKASWVSTRVSDSINVSAASWCRCTTSRGEGAAASVSLVQQKNLARTFPALNPLLPSAAVFSNRWKHKLQVSVYHAEVWGSPTRPGRCPQSLPYAPTHKLPCGHFGPLGMGLKDVHSYVGTQASKLASDET